MLIAVIVLWFSTTFFVGLDLFGLTMQEYHNYKKYYMRILIMFLFLFFFMNKACVISPKL